MQFKDILGQQDLSNKLTEVIDSGRVSHAQLFLGATEKGSLALAIAYAQYLCCEHRQHFAADEGGGLRADSCGKCHNCKQFEQLAHTDLHFVFPNAANEKVKKDPSSEEFQNEFRQFLHEHHQRGSINDWYAAINLENKQGVIREQDSDNVTKALSLKSYQGSYKMVIIWMAEKMNIVAANKLLKTLEEPSPQTLIILVAENADKMLSTILSRTQLVRVPDVGHTDTWPEEFPSLFVAWMRMLFKLNMLRLSAQVDQLAALKKEQQKLFLIYSLDTIHRCFLNTVAGVPIALHSGDEKFDAAFPAMVTVRNVEAMTKALGDMLYAIERNASPKIAFMQLSFTLSKLIKNR